MSVAVFENDYSGDQEIKSGTKVGLQLFFMENNTIINK